MEQERKRKGPDVKLGQYKGLAVTRHVRPVAESAVEQELRHQQRIHAVYRPSDQPAHPGSRVLLDFEGFQAGEPIPDSRMENVMLVLGEGKMMPAAEQAVCGHCAGETFRFDFTYPDDFRLPELAGTTAQFEIRLHSVAEKAVPEASDEFAKSLGYASLEGMRQAIRQHKAELHEANADRKAEAELLDMAGANLTVDLSGSAVEKLTAQELAKLEEKLKRSNVSMEKHCQRLHTTPEALRAETRRSVEQRMRNVLAAKSIAEAENITVRPEEVDAEYKRLSQLHETPEAEIRKVLSEEAVTAAVAMRKVQEFLLANAAVTTVTDGENDKE